MESILSLDHIYYSYHDKNGETPVINDLSFEIKPGSFTSIVGPSGCGKSTLLSLLCDLIKPEAGTIYIRPAQRIIQTPGWDICCRKIICLNGAVYIKMLC